MAQQILKVMNENKEDRALVAVYCQALDELHVCYMFDSYMNEWIETNGIWRPKRSHRR